MDQEIELRHLRYFVAVAEELHFGRAAKRLHLSQPPLSQQIRRLEELLGYPLFVRTSRAVRLTGAGQVFLERALRTMRKMEEDVEAMRTVARGEAGTLGVGFIGSGMLTTIPAMLGQYRARFPNVNLQLREMYTSGVIRALKEGSLDVGFLRDGGPTEGLEVETLFSEPFLAVLPAKHPLAKRSDRRPMDAGELASEPFVFFSPTAGSRAYEKPVSICEAAGFRPRVVQEAPQWLTIMRLVGAGLGVSIGPACAERIRTPEVVCRRLRAPTGKTAVLSEIELARRAGDDRPIVDAFCKLAREKLKKH
ncbi:MAG TPA: LysR substrate-binding domain-containing protein [Terracidiphilus sp.]|jgi:DNA-binding transcriptional LysR family regulator|nr:LysR substrate-binding domain-containing protein [Terracidiphilus sp.]